MEYSTLGTNSEDYVQLKPIVDHLNKLRDGALSSELEPVFIKIVTCYNRPLQAFNKLRDGALSSGLNSFATNS